MFSYDVAIIGAGPYGLSIAAHVRAERLDTVVFGRVMGFWKNTMPKGMLLRSPWTGSHFGDPNRALTLDHFAAAEGVTRSEPIPLDFFIRYGEWFQRAAVPQLDQRTVTRVECIPNGFQLSLEDGDTVRARRVVVATGLEGHEHRPPQFSQLPPEAVSHSSGHRSLQHFAGKRVAVIGAGQSALETAALLLENGADVDLVARASTVHWIGNPENGWSPLSKLAEHFSAPGQIGPFPLNWIVEYPDLLRVLPLELKRSISRRALRPAGASWLFPRTRSLRIRTSRIVVSAVQTGSEVGLKLDDRSDLSVDHVLLATGFRPDITKYPFLPSELTSRMASSDRYPVLSSGMESSVSGLYFAGAIAVPSFGPYMRFVAGSAFAGRRLARDLARQARRGTRSQERVVLSAGVPAPNGVSSVPSRETAPLAAGPSVLKQAK